jgi:hypothetical protein
MLHAMFPTRPPDGKGGWLHEERRGRHGHITTSMMGESQVRAWTKFAHANKIQFSGQRAYKLPKGFSKPVVGKSHERSLEAATRRKQRRMLSGVLRKGWSPQTIKEPLVVRPSMSSRELSALWRHSDVPRRTLRKQVVKPVLATPLSRFPVSKPVIDAITRIYSSVVYTEKNVRIYPSQVVKDNKEFSVREEGRLPLMADLKARMAQIEHEGFKETARWFKLNHLVYNRPVT